MNRTVYNCKILEYNWFIHLNPLRNKNKNQSYWRILYDKAAFSPKHNQCFLEKILTIYPNMRKIWESKHFIKKAKKRSLFIIH